MASEYSVARCLIAASLVLTACEGLLGIDLDEVTHVGTGGSAGRPDGQAGTGGNSGAGGDDAGSGGAAGDSGADAPADSQVVVVGTFVGGRVSAESGNVRLHGRVVWNAQIQGSGTGYRLEGSLR